jgi:hypothetical protein
MTASIQKIRLVVAFYCLATLDVLGAVESSTKEWEREEWRSWLWAQQVGKQKNVPFSHQKYLLSHISLFFIAGSWGAGFRGSPSANQPSSSVRDWNPSHGIKRVQRV